MDDQIKKEDTFSDSLKSFRRNIRESNYEMAYETMRRESEDKVRHLEDVKEIYSVTIGKQTDKITSLKEENNEKEKIINEMKKQEILLTNELVSITQSKRRLEKENGNNKDKIQELKKEIEMLKAEIRRLEKELDLERNQQKEMARQFKDEIGSMLKDVKVAILQEVKQQHQEQKQDINDIKHELKDIKKQMTEKNEPKSVPVTNVQIQNVTNAKNAQCATKGTGGSVNQRIRELGVGNRTNQRQFFVGKPKKL